MWNAAYYGLLGTCAVFSVAAVYSILTPQPAPVRVAASAPVSAETPAKPVASEVPEWKCDITLEDYKSLKVGMSYSRVRGALGCEGKEKYRNDYGGDKSFVNYEWDVPGGGSVYATFENDGLRNKSWSGR